jgi:hypothetical protein
MIFYIATDRDGLKHCLTVETEAKKIDKAYITIDQPNDKASLKALIQDSFNQLHALERQMNHHLYPVQIGGAAAAAPAEGPEQDIEQVATAEPSEPVGPQAVVPPARPPYADKKEPCPRCKFNIDQAKNHVATWLKLAQQDAIENFILDADWALLGTIASNVAYRFEQMAKKAS